jgi:predicted transcriptional regulator of viral defense system
MMDQLRKSAVTEEFDYNFILHHLSDYKNPRVKINDLLKKGDIVRVKKGLYVFGERWARQSYSRETLANLIYGPSYISLEYALSFYGLIPERVETVTSVTNKRKKIFHTPIGIFSYRYIHPDLFAVGTTLKTADKYHTILFATPEKALCDVLYFIDSIGNEEELRVYFFEDLRIEEGELKKMNLSNLKKIASLYGGNSALFYQVLKGMK